MASVLACKQNNDKAVARFTDQHGGLAQEEGMKIPEELFGGLSSEIELCEDAPALSTSNVWVTGMERVARFVL